MSEPDDKQPGAIEIPKTYMWFGLAAVIAIVIILVGFVALQPSDSTPSDDPNQQMDDSQQDVETPEIVETGDDYVPEYTGGPRASLSDVMIDYGDVKLGETVEAVFTVTNVGDENLYFAYEPQVELVEGC